MAKIRLGQLAGEVSGALGSTVFSHNRFGTYVRLRAVPTNTTSAFTNEQRNRYIAMSRNWAVLTTKERVSWKTLAQTNPITDRLGDKRTMSAFQQFMQTNTLIDGAGGTWTKTAVVTITPAALTAFSFTAVAGVGTVDLTWTPTPIGANTCLVVDGVVSDKPGRLYIANLWKQIVITAANEASPYDITAALRARFGFLASGMTVTLRAHLINNLTGGKSGPVEATVVVA